MRLRGFQSVHCITVDFREFSFDVRYGAPFANGSATPITMSKKSKFDSSFTALVRPHLTRLYRFAFRLDWQFAR